MGNAAVVAAKKIHVPVCQPEHPPMVKVTTIYLSTILVNAPTSRPALIFLISGFFSGKKTSNKTVQIEIGLSENSGNPLTDEKSFEFFFRPKIGHAHR